MYDFLANLVPWWVLPVEVLAFAVFGAVLYFTDVPEPPTFTRNPPAAMTALGCIFTFVILLVPPPVAEAADGLSCSLRATARGYERGVEVEGVCYCARRLP